MNCGGRRDRRDGTEGEGEDWEEGDEGDEGEEERAGDRCAGWISIRVDVWMPALGGRCIATDERGDCMFRAVVLGNVSLGTGESRRAERDEVVRGPTG